MRPFLKIGFFPAGIIFCALLVFSSITFAGTYSGGSGTAEDPYKISTLTDWQELIAASADWDKYFILLNDIDFAGVSISPIGDDTTKFSGVFDGNGHTISGFSFETCWWDDEIGYICHGEYIGLFKQNLGTIRNLGLLDCQVQGGWGVGCLAGKNEGTIENCFSTGSASIRDMVGGLVGLNDNGGRIINCYSKAHVQGLSAVGGLVGEFGEGSIIHCFSTGVVVSPSIFLRGGLVGDAGEFEGTVQNSFWDVESSGLASSWSGIGLTTEEMKTLATFTDAGWDFTYSDGNPPVWKMGPDGYPALFWEFRYSGGSGTAEDPYKISTVTDWQELITTSTDWDKNFILLNDIDFSGMNLTPVGLGATGFSGFFDGNGYVLRNAVFEWQSNPESGLFGTIDNGTIQNLTLDKMGSNGSYSGILCVYNRGTIRNCHVAASTSLYPYSGGGLCAENHGTIDHCSAWVGISGADYGVVGGLCGVNSGTIQNSFAMGWVGGGSWCQGGGLCGRNEGGIIAHCYAAGEVGSYDYPAGLCSYNSGTIDRCYATGLVTDMVGGMYLNGLCAVNEGTISHSFWDVETTHCSGSSGGEGKTTAEMKTLATFTDAGWDFVYSDGNPPVWKMGPDGYPALFWEYRYSGGSGTSADPYTISKVADWQELIATSADWDKHFILINDIDFEGANLTPVGDQSNPFTGSLDGLCHSLHHINISMTDSDFVGLFGFLGEGSQIVNLSVHSISVCGHNGVGGLFGFSIGTSEAIRENTIIHCDVSALVEGVEGCGGLGGISSGIIQNCSSAGTVQGNQYVGGMVGNLEHGILTDCTSSNTVKGNQYVGGMAGVNGGGIMRYDRCIMADVTGSQYVGGMVGWNVSGTITCSDSSGIVRGDMYVGGFVGSIRGGTITSCASHGTAVGGTSVGGFLGHNWPLGKGTVTLCYSTGEVTGGNNIGGFAGSGASSSTTACFWDTETSGCNNSPAGVGKTTAEMKTLSTFTSAGWDFTSSDGTPPVWWMPENDYPALVPFRYFGGTGTQQDPFQIRTIGDWQELIASSADWDKHFILINDIDFGGIELTPVAPDTDSMEDNGFQGTPFSGSLDGNHHVLSNFKIDESDKDYIGLIGQSDNGEIWNLGLVNATINGRDYVGGLVGDCYYGTITACYTTGSISSSGQFAGGLAGRNVGNTITSCYVTGAVIGGSDAGGLIGFNSGSGTITSCYTTGSVIGVGPDVGGLAGANEGTITSCSATGSVSGPHDVGGLVGNNYNSGTILSCYATGSVTGSSAGGLVGSNVGYGVVKFSYATGSVNGFYDYIGGLVGENNHATITSCFATGSVSFSPPHGIGGGLVGGNELGTITSCFWDMQTSGLNYSAEGTGKTTAEMKTLATFTEAGWDFVSESGNGTADVWRMCEDGVDYPRLAWEFSDDGDFVCPDGVALEDLLYLSERWMANTPESAGAADANGDGKVNLVDFGIVGENWMQE